MAECYRRNAVAKTGCSQLTSILLCVIIFMQIQSEDWDLHFLQKLLMNEKFF